MKAAGITAGEVNGIIGVTTVPGSGEYMMPGFARMVGDAMGLSNIPMHTVASGCAGGVSALVIAKRYMSEESPDSSYLVVAGEQTSSVLNPDDWGTYLFSDGAAALVLTKKDVRGFKVRKTGSKALPSELGLYSMVLRNPFLSEDDPKFEMEGRKVFAFASREVYPAMLELVGLDRLPNDCYLIPHQPSRRILEHIKKHNGLMDDQMLCDGIMHGNMGAASVFSGLDVERRGGFLARYKHVLLGGFGAELVVSAAYLDNEI
jgi:3-oxoacyl-[acyl-carrier-protein] synthase III